MGKVHFIDSYSASVSVAYSCHLRPKVNSELSVKEDEPKRILVALCLPREDGVSVSVILFISLQLDWLTPSVFLAL